MSTKLALVLAILLGFIAVIGLKSWMKKDQKEKAEKYEPKYIVLANKSIKAGAPLRDEDVARFIIPKRFITVGMIPWDDRLSKIGKIVKQTVDKGAPVFSSNLTNKIEDQTNLSVVNPGMRASTIRVDQVSGNAGLLKPGNYVDVIATFDTQRLDPALMAANGGKPAFSRNTETVYILQAAKILALDANTMSVGRGGQRTKLYRTVTLEVKPINALRLTNAMSQGRIQLLLRNPGETKIEQGSDEATQAPTFNVDVLDEVQSTKPYLTN